MSILVLAPLRDFFGRLFSGRASGSVYVPGLGRLERDGDAWWAEIPRPGAPEGLVRLVIRATESGCTPEQLALATCVFGDLDRFEEGALSAMGADRSKGSKVLEVVIEEDDGSCTPILLASGGRLALDMWLETPDDDDGDGSDIVSCVVGGTPQRPEFYKGSDGCSCPRCKAG